MNIPPPTAIIKTEFRYDPINKITAVTQRKRSSSQSMPRFTIYSTRKGHSQHAVPSS